MAETHPSDPNAADSQLLSQLKLPAGWIEVHLAVAVSGGADSVALLRAVQHLKAKFGGAGQLIAMHVNHQLRGLESDDDDAWVRQLCGQLQIPLEALTADTASFANANSLGLETAARQLRYRLLVECAERLGVRYLAMAHTRNDQVETVLFRTLRGTGLRGLAGIPAARSLTPSVTLIRPLLDCSRQCVVNYLSALDQQFRTDSSNVDRQFTRNRLRHDLLPDLRNHYNDELDAAIVRLSHQAREAQAVIEQLAEQLLSKANLEETRAGCLCFDCQPFVECEPLVVSEALRIVWRRANLGEQAMAYEWWCTLAKFVQSGGSPSPLNLPGNVSASIDGQRFVLEW